MVTGSIYAMDRFVVWGGRRSKPSTGKPAWSYLTDGAVFDVVTQSWRWFPIVKVYTGGRVADWDAYFENGFIIELEDQ